MTDSKKIAGIKVQEKVITPSKMKKKLLAEGNKPQRNATSLTPYGAYIPGMSQVKKMTQKDHPDGPLYADIYKNEIENKPSIVAVVDKYTGDQKENGILIDDDEKPDIYHGDLVTEYIKSGGKNITTQRIDAKETTETLSKRLKSVADGEYQDFDAVNISLACNIKYSDVAQTLGVDGVTPATLADKRSEIIYGLATTEGYNDIYQSIRHIDKIVKNGTPVYIAAGNESDSFNALTLAKGSVSVGGLETDGPDKGKPIKEFSQNTEIDLYYPGKYRVNKVSSKDNFLYGRIDDTKGKKEEEFFNLGGGIKGGSVGKGVVLIPLDEMTSNKPSKTVNGTSLASPNALTEDPTPYKINWGSIDKSKSWDETLDSIKFE